MPSQVSERRFDLSRDTFDEKNCYRSVVKQQGRVTVDADHNEQRRIDLHRSDLTTLDVIGPSGYPQGGTGFAITTANAGQTLDVGLGRMYVDGIMCENFNPAPTLMLDSTTAGQPAVPVSGTTAYTNVTTGTYLIYLDVWERDITALDDTNIRETALGGADTAARTQIVTQVHLESVGAGTTCATAALPGASAHSGTLDAQTDPGAAALDCTLPPLAGYRGQFNQNYRVEIQTGGAVGTATYKWSRENASVVTGITGGTTGYVGSTFTVQSLGTGDVTLAFGNNQWVELIDDTYIASGQPGPLALISVDPSTLTMTLAAGSPVNVIQYGKNPKIRRWDQADLTASNGLVTSSAWVDLETPSNGVQVMFGGGTYVAGDYWMIPARTAIDAETGVLLWPPPGTPQLPHYTRHHQAKLAVGTYDTTTGWTDLSDCRISFPPLTNLPASGTCCCSNVTVGDGVTSTGQYTDIATAIAAVASGGVVAIEAGNYVIATPIDVPAGVTLRGCGTSTSIAAANGAFIITGSNVTICDLAIEVQTAAAIATSTSATVQNVVIRGVNIAASSTAGKPATVAYGITLSGTNLEVDANVLTYAGIEIQTASTNVRIDANTVTSPPDRAISLGTAPVMYAYADYAYVDDAAHDHGSVAGIGSYSSVNTTNLTLATISGVTIERNTLTGAANEGIGGESFAGATTGAQLAGQAYLTFSDITISKNVITGCVLGTSSSTSRVAAAISIPVVEGFVVCDNVIAENGPNSPAGGIFVLFGGSVEIRGNRILQNGTGAPAEGSVAIAGIEVWFAIAAPASLNGVTTTMPLAAATVTGNTVATINAPSLYMLAIGQVSVTGNDFTVVGQSTNPATIGQCVDILNLGSGAQENIASNLTLWQAAFGVNATTAYTTQLEVDGGQVLFSGNRCLVDARDVGADLKAAVYIESVDACTISGNQIRCFVNASTPNGTAGVLIANLLALAPIAQVSGNRLSEDSALASALVIGGDTIGIGNHGTHCLLFSAAGRKIDDNIVNPLNADICKELEAQLARLITGP